MSLEFFSLLSPEEIQRRASWLSQALEESGHLDRFGRTYMDAFFDGDILPVEGHPDGKPPT
jgi:hypothetical protein